MAAGVATDGVPQFESAQAAYEWVYAARAYNPVNPDHNWQKPADVDGNGRVETFDLLKVVTPMREGGRLLDSLHAEGEDGQAAPSRTFIDVNADRQLSITDVLGVVQALRAEGENGMLASLIPSITDGTTTATVGDTYDVTVFVQDLRTEDPNPNNNVDDRGIFSATVDLNFDENFSASPIPNALRDEAAAPFFGVGYRPTDPQFSLSNINRQDVNTIRITGVVANFFTPLGPDQEVLATIPFKVGAVADFVTGTEETALTIDVLANDTSASGTQTFTTDVPDVTSAVLLHDQGDLPDNEVAEEDVMTASTTISVNVPGAPTLTSITSPANGTASIVNGMVSYTPNGNFFGEDTFMYTITYPGGVTDTAEVTVTVQNTPDDPIAVDDNQFRAVPDSVLNVPAPGVLGNDTDPDIDPDLSPNNVNNDAITVTAVNGETADVGQTITLASGATLLLRANGSFDYDPTGV
ncbi:MAG: hypothetical protein KY475_09655, partial [Planctomycetes bacterium]|nr:hypothetical protein [Planctomycetota bacterium]